MKKSVAMLVICLKAVLVVLNPEKLKWLKEYNKTRGKNMPRYKVREMILVEVRKSMRKMELASKEAKLNAEIADMPMSFSDKAGWDHRTACAHENPEHWYDLAVLEYAEKWARLMELRMHQGKTLQEVAGDTMFEAYTNDKLPVGRSLSCALDLLTMFWKYGEELSRCIRIRTDEEIVKEIIAEDERIIQSYLPLPRANYPATNAGL